MILSGKIVAEKIYTELKEKLNKLRAEDEFAVSTAGLVIFQIGHDPASDVYVKLKKKIGEELELQVIPSIIVDATPDLLMELIGSHNNMPIADTFARGIVVQLPLPSNFNVEEIMARIDPDKDIDGFSGFYPAPTPAAILEILKHYQINYKKMRFVLVGHGRLVGQPLEKMLKKEGIEPVICDSKTQGLKKQTLQADILVSATGQPGIIQPDMVRPETIVIDAGTAESNGKMVGDVDPKVYQKVQTYTPTPGGVGPVTVAMLYKNLVKSIEIRVDSLKKVDNKDQKIEN